MHFDKGSSHEGNDVNGYSIHSSRNNSYSFRINFTCTDNIYEFKTLILGLENAPALGWRNITIFGDLGLIINLVKKEYTPLDKMMRRYTTLVYEMTNKFMSFNIIHIRRGLNASTYNLATYVARPNQHLIYDNTNYSVISIYRPHIPDNIKSWEIFDDDEYLHAFVTNQVSEY